MMRILSCLLVLAFLASPAWAGEVHELMMDRDDVFHVAETDQWRVRVERYLPIRFANVRIDGKQGYHFSLMLYFKCDTPDLADYDSPEKIKRSILISSQKYLDVTMEKEVKLLKVAARHIRLLHRTHRCQAGEPSRSKTGRVQVHHARHGPLVKKFRAWLQPYDKRCRLC
jgi:hypothetical protein